MENIELKNDVKEFFWEIINDPSTYKDEIIQYTIHEFSNMIKDYPLSHIISEL